MTSPAETAAREAGGIDLDAVGASVRSEFEWTSKDAMLYAVGVGAGQQDPASELEFTTENSKGIRQRALPTLPLVLGLREFPPFGDVKLSQILHAEQSVELHDEFPVEGKGHSITTVAAIYDKTKGALVQLRSELFATDREQPLAVTEAGIFVLGAGGFGGDRGPTDDWELPEGRPDHELTMPTTIGQALLYRLNGDRNPLHSDPQAAAAAGYPRPILHGLCTYGVVGRALLSAVCDGDPAKFGKMRARFSAPVLPGQELAVSIWQRGEEAVFQVSTPDTGVVLDRGLLTLAPAS